MKLPSSPPRRSRRAQAAAAAPGRPATADAPREHGEPRPASRVVDWIDERTVAVRRRCAG